MSDLDDSFAKLLGRQPTDADRQQLYRIRDALGLKNNDALWLVLMALQSYDERYKAIPAQISKASADAAASAAAQAQAEVNRAVAALVPSVEQAVAKAASGAVARIQLGTSLFSVWAGTLMLGFMFGFGWALGSGIYIAAAKKSITWSQFFGQTGWGIGLGSVIPSLLVLGMANMNDGAKSVQRLCLLAGFACVLVLLVGWLNSLTVL